MFAIVLMVSVVKCAGLMFISAVVGAAVSYAFRGKEHAAIQIAGDVVKAEVGKVEKKL